MAFLADTNVLLYWLQPNSPERVVAMHAVRILHGRGEKVYVLPQNIIELWNRATRPIAAGGLGLTVAQTDAEARYLESLFPVLYDTPVIYDAWRQLVVSVGVSGVQVYDARIAAAMRIHGLTDLLTFNPADFIRYPGINAVHPRDI